MNGVQFSAGLDGSRFISGTKDMQNATTATGKLIDEVFGRKLKQVISVVAIEQAVQRTADWAQQITQASKNLGTTAEQLQTLQHIASATGTAESAVTGLFDNIQKAGQGAIDGNSELITSFKKLGITVQDIMGMTNAQLFSKVLNNPDLANIRDNPDQLLRRSVNNITGTPENTLQSIKVGYDNTAGQGLSGKADVLMQNNDIAKEKDVKELSAIWSQILTSLKEAGTQLLPVATLLLTIVKTLVDALGGIAEACGSLFKVIAGIFTGNTEKIKSGLTSLMGLTVNEIMAIPSLIAHLVEGVLSTLGKLTHLNFLKTAGKVVADTVDKQVNYVNNKLGINKDTARRGQAITEAVSMVASGGEANLARLGSYASRGVATGAGKVGLRSLAKGATEQANKFDAVGERTIADYSKFQQTKTTLSPSELKDAFKEANDARNIVLEQNKATSVQWKDSKGNVGGHYEKLDENGVSRRVSDKEEADIDAQILKAQKERFASKYGLWNEVKAGLGIAGTAGVVGATGLANFAGMANNPNSIASGNVKPFGLPMMFQQMAGGSANLKMGGMFGIGTPLERIVALNTSMNEHLGAIAQNTRHYKLKGPVTTLLQIQHGAQAGGL